MISFVNYQKSEAYTAFAKKIFETSFPLEERPPFEKLKHRNPEKFFFNIVELNSTPIGIFSYWKLNNIVYVEHFAIQDSQRNKGIGKLVLQYFLEGLFEGSQIVFEVELPENEIARRRIAFYKRNGFVCNDLFEYSQPPYHKGFGYFPMYIMSRFKLSATEFESVKKTLYYEVYGCK